MKVKGGLHCKYFPDLGPCAPPAPLSSPRECLTNACCWLPLLHSHMSTRLALPHILSPTFPPHAGSQIALPWVASPVCPATGFPAVLIALAGSAACHPKTLSALAESCACRLQLQQWSAACATSAHCTEESLVCSLEDAQGLGRAQALLLPLPLPPSALCWPHLRACPAPHHWRPQPLEGGGPAGDGMQRPGSVGGAHGG